jgi:Autophagy-related protein 13.
MNSSQAKIGPRTKCDQVMYEAIAKAAEIIVRGRCQLSPDEEEEDAKQNSSNYNNNSSNNNNNNSTSRFNLELPPIASVRSILQMWKTSLHVPLRLDVYYEYCTDPTDPEKNTRKELLERWCIDYIPSYLLKMDHPMAAKGQGQEATTSSRSPSNNNNMRLGTATTEELPYNSTTGTSTDMYPSSSSSLWQGGSVAGTSAPISSLQRQQQQTQQRRPQPSLQLPQHGTDDTIAQLRQVVKRIVIQLRVLWSMTRMMPAYQLYDALLHEMTQQQQQQMSWKITVIFIII